MFSLQATRDAAGSVEETGGEMARYAGKLGEVDEQALQKGEFILLRENTFESLGVDSQSVVTYFL